MENFDWETEEQSCDIEQSESLEMTKFDSSKTIASRTTGCSDKMRDSPLRNKGHLKAQDHDRFIELVAVTEVKEKRLTLAASRKKPISQSNIVREDSRLKLTEITRMSQSKKISNVQAAADIKLLLREISNRKNECNLSKSVKLVNPFEQKIEDDSYDSDCSKLDLEHIITMNDIEAPN